MKRLLMVVPDFYPSNSGYSNAIQALVTALAESGRFELCVICPSLPEGSGPEFSAPNTRIHRLPRSSRGLAAYLRTELRVPSLLSKMEREFSPDVIFFETAEFPISLVRSLAKKTLRRKIWLRIHASADTEWVLYYKHPVYRFKALFARRVFSRLETIISTNPYHLQFVRERFLAGDPFVIGGKQLEVLPNLSLDAAPASAPLHTRKISLLTLGRMAYPGYIEKNFMRVLEAVHLLRSEPWFAELELIVIGKGKAKEKLVTFAKELGIDSAVTWVDAATNAEVQALQRSVSFVVLASIHEGMSSFALESLKNGAGLLVSRNTGVEDMVREGHNGFLFDPYSTRDIARCIKSAVETLLPKIEQVRSASLAHFADNFSSARVLQRFDEIWTVWEARNKSGLQEVGQ